MGNSRYVFTINNCNVPKYFNLWSNLSFVLLCVIIMCKTNSCGPINASLSLLYLAPSPKRFIFDDAFHSFLCELTRRQNVPIQLPSGARKVTICSHQMLKTHHFTPGFHISLVFDLQSRRMPYIVSYLAHYQ